MAIVDPGFLAQSVKVGDENISRRGQAISPAIRESTTAAVMDVHPPMSMNRI
jgi:hypothetical protein